MYVKYMYRCSVFLLDSLGQELVATVFDGAVQAKVSNYVYSSTHICMYMYSTSSNAPTGMCELLIVYINHYCVRF